MTEKITGEMLIREVVIRHPGIEQVFALHGLEGCGGPKGPLEPVAFFSRVHRVDVDVLLKDLNDFIEGKQLKPIPEEVKARAAPVSNLYKPFLYSALLIGLTMGMGLGALNLAHMAEKKVFVSLWPSLTQVHASLQMMGWVGLFIMGVAYTVVPRLRGTTLVSEKLAWTSFWLVLAGLILRTFSQPLALSSWAKGGLVLSGILELAGVSLFIGIIFRTVGRGSLAHEFFENYLKAALGWLGLGSLGNLILIIYTVSQGQTVIPEAYFAPYITVMLLGFITMMIMGIGLRTHPEFLALKAPDRRAVALLFLVMNGALIFLVAGEIGQAISPGGALAIISLIGGLALGMALLSHVILVNPFQKPNMDLTAMGVERDYEKFIKTAYLWLIPGSLLLIGISLFQGLAGMAVPYYWMSAFRHIIAVGFISTMMMGQASKIVPVFAGSWLYSPLMLMPTFLLLTSGNLLRVGSQITAGVWGGPSYIIMGISGFLQWIALALFSFNLWQSMEGKGKPRETKRPIIASEGLIKPDMTVGDVLEKYPEALEVFLRHGFAPLANPVARSTMAKMVTIEQATKIHPVDINKLLEELNQVCSRG